MLDKIIENKKREVKEAKRDFPLKEMLKEIDSPDFREFYQKRDFKKAIEKSGLSLIAEVKQKSPSYQRPTGQRPTGGKFREDFDYLEIARIYQKTGAKAISVLTDKRFFGGELSHLTEIKENISLPVLRKDFIVDEYQICQSFFYKADAVLLIVCLLSERELKEFLRLCRELGLDALVEVHNQEDIKKALDTPDKIIGINNRNLDSLEIDIKTTEKLIKLIPDDKLIVSESGIRTKEDVKYLRDLGLDGVLIGEIFLKSKDIAKKIKEMGLGIK